MYDIKFHRITDFNNGVYDRQKHTRFEAGFYMFEGQSLALKGKIIDSDEKEIFSSQDLRDLSPDRYRDWNPKNDLSNCIADIESHRTAIEPSLFQAPFLEVSIEVKGPIAQPNIFAVMISMSLNIRILEQYEWKDSGNIKISILCRKNHLLDFFRGLQSDLSKLRLT